MSFPIVLCKNSSPMKKVDKALTVIQTVNGVLREGTSVVDPVILIESAPANVVANANYARIETFGRYYYITDIKSGPNGLWIISMHVDVLMSYKTAIRAQNAIIARQENEYNMYLDDGWFMAYQNPNIEVHYFSEAHPFDHEELVLVLAGS